MTEGKTLVLGIGNLLMGDEGVGVEVVRRVEAAGAPRDVECLDGGTGGFHLLGPVQDAGRVILVDATADGAAPGSVRRLQPRFSSDYPKTLTAHDIGLKDLLDAMFLLGDEPDVTLFAVSIEFPQPMGIGLTPAVAAAVPAIVDRVLEEASVGEGMGDTTFWSLITAAVGVAVIHTVLGPDHYLPFVMLSRARRWSIGRTVGITALFGVAHVLSSVLLGTMGLAAGVAVGRLAQWEQARGTLAAWMLVTFGVTYLSWGLRRAVRRTTGIEPHDHQGHVHVHRDGADPHHHTDPKAPFAGPTFWSLLAIFVLGPCEPLIPLFVLPASRGDWAWAVWTAVAFGVATVASMVATTLIGLAGLRPALTARLARFSHALAGAVIAASGLAILFLGL